MRLAIQKYNQNSFKKLFAQVLQLISDLPHNRNLFNQNETVNNNNKLKKHHQQVKNHH